jgi:hypothetical protein
LPPRTDNQTSRKEEEMKKIALVALVASGALAAAGAAQAKEIVSLKLCGTTGCNTVTDRDTLRGWEAEGDPAQVWQPMPAAFYTVAIAFGDDKGNVIHSDTAYWLPSSNLMRFQGQKYDPWWRLFPSQKALFVKIASGLEPFVPRLARVRVKGKNVTDPDSYLRLFGPLRDAVVPYHVKRWVRIRMLAAEPNPWISHRVLMKYAPRIRLLVRPDGYYRVPKRLARKVMRRASLAPAGASTAPVTRSGDGGNHTTLYAGVGLAGFAVLAALGVGATLARRKRSDS